MTNTVWYKSGVAGDLQPVARKGLGRVARVYFDAGLDLFVTSIRDGNHAPGSLHYDGLAFDIKGQSVFISVIAEVLGPDWDVVDEISHYHIEYDPK